PRRPACGQSCRSSLLVEPILARLAGGAQGAQKTEAALRRPRCVPKTKHRRSPDHSGSEGTILRSTGSGWQAVINPALNGGALQIKSMAHNHFNPVRVRRDYVRPARNYSSRVDVGVCSVAAREARERIASLAVGLLGVTADAALTGGVSRIDVADRKPNTRGLVGDLRLKITEGPRVKSASLRPGSPYPCAD